MPVSGFQRTGTMRVWSVVNGRNAKKLLRSFGSPREIQGSANKSSVPPAKTDVARPHVRTSPPNPGDQPTLAAGSASPFAQATPQLNHWIVAGSVAGVAATVVVGAAIFGSSDRVSMQVAKPVQTILQAPESHTKGDLARPAQSAQITGSIPDSSSPYDRATSSVSG